VDGIICRHIHHTEMSEIIGIRYCNDRDWIESCTALTDISGNQTGPKVQEKPAEIPFNLWPGSDIRFRYGHLADFPLVSFHSCLHHGGHTTPGGIAAITQNCPGQEAEDST